MDLSPSGICFPALGGAEGLRLAGTGYVLPGGCL
jgi:hypothetical protein